VNVQGRKENVKSESAQTLKTTMPKLISVKPYTNYKHPSTTMVATKQR
jgi:hypothetical protein